MNRDIKFRAWDKKYKTMHLGDIRAALVYPQEDIEIMQFIGLQDKNGKDIYEGDIVQTYHGNDKHTICEIVYMDHGFYQKEDKEDEPKHCFWHYIFEVIGNIHENPELME